MTAGLDRTRQAPAARRSRRRVVLFAAGWLFFALGAVGAVLPVVPTTPFMLLALWAFSSSSERFHDWLYNHRVFGPPLQRWKRERVVPLWTKAVAILSMTVSLVYVGLEVKPPWYALAGMIAVVVAGIAFLASVPSRSRSPAGRGAPPDAP